MSTATAFDFVHSNEIHIPHLSASTINSFITDRFGFYQSKVKKKPFAGNEFTARGTAVEHAVNEWLENGHTNVEEVALARFDEEMRKNGLSKFDGEEVRDTIPGLARLAFNTYLPIFGEHKAKTQHKISTNLDGVSREIVGYLDFYQEGVRVRDSKVVSRTPSSMSQNYVLQGALYRHAMQVPVTFDYFVANKTPVHKPITLSDDDFIFGLSYLTKAAQVIEEIEVCDNPQRLLELMSFPNLDALYNRKDKKAAAEIWGIAF